MNNYLILFLLLLLSACSHHKEASLPWDPNISTEQNIAKNAIALNTNDDFYFLDGIIDGRSILLGEEGHFDPTTAMTRMKMFDYLQKRGYNSVALEGHSFLASYMLSNPNYKELTRDWEIRPFVDYTEDLMETDVFKQNMDVYESFIKKIRDQKIKIWGIDCSASVYDIEAVKAILTYHSALEYLSVDWNKLSDFYYRKLANYCWVPQLTSAEEYELMSMIDAISNYTQYLIFSRGEKTDLKVIMQWIQNMNTLFSHIELQRNDLTSLLDPDKLYLLAFFNRNRDAQMARNVDWIRSNFPNENLVIWAANFHTAKDISQTVYPTDSLFYFKNQTMGEFLAATYGEKMYSLAFSSLNYSKTAQNGELEIEIANVTDDAPFAFVNYESLRFSDGYRDKEFDSRVIRKKRGKWLHIFDGIYYIRDQR